MNLVSHAHQRLCLILIAILLITACQKGEKEKIESEVDYSNSLFDKLYNIENLTLEIDSNLDNFIANKSKEEKVYQEAKITASGDLEIDLSGSCTIRPRGVTRKRICDFPPMMIRVNSDQEQALGIGPSENIKLVTFCKDSIGYEDLVLKEYLAYSLYNELNEHSFRVKLINVHYRNNGVLSYSKDGFIIEPLEELAHRLNCGIIDEEDKITTVHKEKYMQLTMFQFMIGNSDWNFSNRHNVRMLGCDDNYGPIPVPYDFDYSGLVNAEYAKPHPMLPINKVTDRLFQWRGSPDEDFSKTLEDFVNRRDRFMDICERYEYHDSSNEESVMSYLNEFYAKIGKPGQVKKEIQKARRG